MRIRRRPVCALAHKVARARDIGNRVLAMISIGALIYFIHHVLVSIQAKFAAGNQQAEWPGSCEHSRRRRRQPPPTG